MAIITRAGLSEAVQKEGRLSRGVFLDRIGRLGVFVEGAPAGWTTGCCRLPRGVVVVSHVV